MIKINLALRGLRITHCMTNLTLVLSLCGRTRNHNSPEIHIHMFPNKDSRKLNTLRVLKKHNFTSEMIKLYIMRKTKELKYFAYL